MNRSVAINRLRWIALDFPRIPWFAYSSCFVLVALLFQRSTMAEPMISTDSTRRKEPDSKRNLYQEELIAPFGLKGESEESVTIESDRAEIQPSARGYRRRNSGLSAERMSLPIAVAKELADLVAVEISTSFGPVGSVPFGSGTQESGEEMLLGPVPEPAPVVILFVGMLLGALCMRLRRKIGPRELSGFQSGTGPVNGDGDGGDRT